MTTMREVAARAGVSTKTVSRVVNNDRYISAGVRERVERAIADLQYVPNVLARTFRSGRDEAVGVAVPDLADGFFATIVRAVEQVARSHGTVVLVTGLGTDPADEQPAVEALLRRQISGLILAPTGSDHRYLEAWQERIGLVFVDRPPRRIKADSVVEDDAGGAAAGVRSLLAAGHRRIAFLALWRGIATTRRRLTGYRDALTAAGIEPDPALEISYADAGRTAEETLRDLLALPDPPTAVFSSNSLTSMQIVPLLHAWGRTDLGLVSFGDFPMSGALRPSIAALDQVPDALGRVAAERLFARIADPSTALRRSQVLPVRLIERDSCRLPGPGVLVRPTTD
jgi:LacI family transcriptional regulator